MASSSSATSDAILQTAARLFMQRGYQAVSINDIVQAAGITKPTLYYHFADKEAVFVKMICATAAALHERMDAVVIGQETTVARLAAVAEVLLREIDGDMRMILRDMRQQLSAAAQAQIGEAFFTHLVAPITAIMVAGAASGELTRNGPDELAALFLGLVSGFIQPQAEREAGEYGTHFSGQQLAELFVYGAR